MQCSFFSALQLHSHSCLPGLGDGRYWAEKFNTHFLQRSAIGMRHLQQRMATGMNWERGAVHRWGTWAGQAGTGLYRGICSTNCRAELVKMLLMFCQAFVLKYIACNAGVSLAEQEQVPSSWWWGGTQPGTAMWGWVQRLAAEDALCHPCGRATTADGHPATHCLPEQRVGTCSMWGQRKGGSTEPARRQWGWKRWVRGVWAEGVLVYQGSALSKHQRSNLRRRWHFLVQLPSPTGDGERRGWKGAVLEKCLPPENLVPADYPQQFCSSYCDPQGFWQDVGVSLFKAKGRILASFGGFSLFLWEFFFLSYKKTLLYFHPHLNPDSYLSYCFHTPLPFHLVHLSTFSWHTQKVNSSRVTEHTLLLFLTNCY